MVNVLTRLGWGVMLGVDVPPMFYQPYFADSPKDFWSRRWNMIIRDLLYTDVFVPATNLFNRISLYKKKATVQKHIQ